ncbi:MAG: DNA-processing protein DprA [Ruminococcus sp.]|nr:DNA-processing protein DprA [Ruminococcus sp.]MBR1824711.1 DNA-processing protein DprA [Ruminococcus sp.]
MNETKYWLWLSMVFGTGSRRIWEVMCLFESAEEAYQSLSEQSVSLKFNEKETDNLSRTEISDAERFIEKCAEKGIGIVGYSDDDYPHQLRHLFNPPAVLYYKGNISCLSGTRTVTAVGTRNATDYGIRTAETVCGELAAKNMVIISGFAVGIDIASQLAGVQKNRPTAAVMGCGVDVNYPKPNEQFRERILKSGGVFLSEYPPETQPLPQNFPSRNRILAALGRAAIVFEASVKSGSLITARLASEQGRDVFVIPPADIFSSKYSGNVQLLREGAQPLYSTEDILDTFRFGSSVDTEIRQSIRYGFDGLKAGIVWEGRAAAKADREVPIIIPRKRIKEDIPQEKPQDTPEPPNVPETSDTFEELTDIQRSIAEELKNGKLHADELCRRLDMDPAELMTELTEMEIMGTVISLPGKMFELYR